MFALVDTLALLSREVLCPSSPQVWLRTSQSLTRDLQHTFCSLPALGTHQSHPTSSPSGLVNIWQASCLFVVVALILLVWLVLNSQGSTYWQWPVGLVRPQRVFKHIESTRVEWLWQKNSRISFTKCPLSTLLSELWKWSRVSFTKCLMGTVWSELWKSSRVSFTKYPLGTVLSSLQKYSPYTQWILGGQIVSEPTMNPPCTHWVNDPLPPVWEILKCRPLISFVRMTREAPARAKTLLTSC